MGSEMCIRDSRGLPKKNTFASWVPEKETDCLVAENGRPAGENLNLQSLGNCAVAAAAGAAAVGFVVQNPTFGRQKVGRASSCLKEKK